MCRPASALTGGDVSSAWLQLSDKAVQGRRVFAFDGCQQTFRAFNPRGQSQRR